LNGFVTTKKIKRITNANALKNRSFSDFLSKIGKKAQFQPSLHE